MTVHTPLSTRLRPAVFLLLVLASLVSLQCFKQPLAPVAPNWDVQLSIPIVDTVYFLKDALRDNSDIGVDSIFYVYRPQRYDFPPLLLGDTNNLRLNPPNPDNTGSRQLGLLTIDAPLALTQTMRASDLFPFVPANRDTTINPIPPVFTFIPGKDTTIVFGLRISDKFEYLQLANGSGSLRLTITNSLPTRLSFPSGPIQIKNSDNTDVALFSFAPIDSGTTQTRTSPLAGTRLMDSIIVSVSMRLDTIFLPATFRAGAGIRFQFDVTGPLKANEARVRVPPTVIADTSVTQVVVDESTYVSEVNFLRGQVQLTIINNIQTVDSIYFRFKELVDNSSGQPFEISATIEPAGFPGNTFSRIIDLQNYSIQSGGTPDTSIHYQLTIQTLGFRDTTVFSTVYDTSSIYVNVHFDNTPFLIRRISGVARPFDLVLNSNVDIPEIKLGSSFTADSILLTDSTVLKIRLQTAGSDPDAGGHPIDLTNFALRGVTGNDSTAGTIAITPNRPNGIWRFLPGQVNEIPISGRDLTSFLAGFPSGQPVHLIVSASGRVNPDSSYQARAVAVFDDSTKLFAGVTLSVPLQVRILNGAFKDTVDIGDTTSNGTRIDPNLLTSIISGTFNFAISNSIPVSLILISRFEGVNNDSLLSKSISVPELGTAVSQVNLSQAEAKKFNDAQHAILRLQMGTPPQGAVFDTTQSIRLRLYANLKFNINPTK